MDSEAASTETDRNLLEFCHFFLGSAIMYFGVVMGAELSVSIMRSMHQGLFYELM